jgi:hypothetical protein
MRAKSADPRQVTANMSEESELEARSVRVSNFLVKKDKASALAAALQNPPVNEKSEKSEELKVSREVWRKPSL